MTGRRVLMWFVAVALTASPAAGQATRPAPAIGGFQATFTLRSPFSSNEVQRGRYGLEFSPAQVYETAKERFFVYVPEEYAADPAGWGLLVWCSAGHGGDAPDEWQPVLARKKLIWVTALEAGNDRGVGARMGLALDAAYNMPRAYALDPHRIYVAGVSGGGKVAEMAALAYPDVFDGAIPCAGANWYTDIAVPGRANSAWPATFRKPPAAVFAEAREHVGFALVAGEKDPNLEPVKAMFDQGFTAEKFQHVTLFEVPGIGHRSPPAQWFEKAVDFLDAVPKDRAKKPLTKFAATAAAGPATRVAASRPAGASGAAAAEPTPAARLLSLARSYRSSGLPDKARLKLEQLLKDYPAAPEVPAAREMLQQMAAGGR